jgi:hypothetical protein
MNSIRELLEKLQHRPVYLIPFRLGPDVLGVWLATDTADYVYYEHNTTPYHQRHIVLHEGSHMIRGHQAPALQAQLARLTPHLDPKLVRSLLCHSVYNEREEAEAEVLATLIEEQIEQSDPPLIRRTDEKSIQSIGRFLREAR